MVYELCLSRGKVFLPLNRYNPSDMRHLDYQDTPKPEWQLLSVNRQMRQEAAKTLFAHNQIVLAPDTNQLLLDNGGGPPEEHSIKIRDLAKHYLASISVAWAMENYLDKSVPMSRYLWHDRVPTHSADERILATHNDSKTYTGGWRREFAMTLTSNVRYIQLDVTDCYCILGCCRMIEQMSNTVDHTKSAFGADLVYPDTLEVIEVTGTKTQAERRSIAEALARGLWKQAPAGGPYKKLTLRFRKFVLSEDSEVRAVMEYGLEEMEDQDVDMKIEAENLERDIAELERYAPDLSQQHAEDSSDD